MKSGKSAGIMIVNSILWAAALIASAILLKGSGYYENISFLLLTLWLASFLMLQEGRESIESEWRCIRRFFNSILKMD
jgi:hypothetical protein